MTAILARPSAARQDVSAAVAPSAGAVSQKARRIAFYAQAHLWLSQAVFAGIVLQVFFAGLGLFTSAGFLAHAVFAPALGVGALALPVAARLGRLPRSLMALSWTLAGLMVAQGLLIDLGRWVWLPISSLHPVNALALILVAYTLARRRGADQL